MTSGERPVLVTGSNRSGTTWVGRMLCASRELSYVHEPFNPGYWPRLIGVPIPFRNLYVCSDNEADYLPAVEALLDHRFPLRSQLGEVRSIKDGLRLGRDALRARVRRLAGRPALVKDPIAIFSTAWLAERFDMGVVVMIRNPLAYAGSLKRLDWRFDFRQWLDQPLLVRDLLGRFERDVAEMAGRRGDVVDEAILQWNVHYEVVDRFSRLHPDWLFVDYDGLAAEPEEGFEEMYRRLGLDFDDRARRTVRDFTREGNLAAPADGDKGPIRRDSRAQRDTWKQRLTPEEVERVLQGTERVRARFSLTL